MGEALDQSRAGWRKNRFMGPVFGAAAIGILVIGYIVLLRLVEGPTVHAGTWFRVKANDVTYRVDVVRNDRHGLLVSVRAWNTTDSPRDPGEDIFRLVAHAGDRTAERDCRKLGCMGGVLDPGETRAFTFPFLLAGPADSLEFLEVGNEISDRVALVRLRPKHG